MSGTYRDMPDEEPMPPKQPPMEADTIEEGGKSAGEGCQTVEEGKKDE